MGSVAEKHKAALELFRRWHLSRDNRREETLKELAELCAAEVSSGLREGGGILVWSTLEHTSEAIRYAALRVRVEAKAAFKQAEELRRALEELGEQLGK